MSFSGYFVRSSYIFVVAALMAELLFGQAVVASPARPAEWAVPVEAQTPNLFRVTPNFYRSAQLKKENVPELESFGIKNVVSLRAFHSDKDLFKKTAIKTHRIKIYTWAIGDDEIVAALKAIRAAEKEGPVLLHCQHGADRTGLVTAMYRVVYQGWDKEKALDELQNGGYGYHALWKNIPPYLRGVDVEKIRQLVDKN